MDTQSIIEALRGLQPREYDWKFCLYSSHKSRDGVDLSWNACAMEGIPGWAEQMARLLLEKTLTERVVTEYSPLLPKEEIGALPKDDPQIRDQISDMLLGIAGAETKAPEDFANGVVSKPAGYAFYGVRPATEDEPVREALFLRRGNPFISGTKALLCVGHSDEICESQVPLLKFTPQVDFLLIDGICCVITESINKDLDLESRAAAVCGRRLEQIAQADVVSSYEQMGAGRPGREAHAQIPRLRQGDPRPHRVAFHRSPHRLSRGLRHHPGCGRQNGQRRPGAMRDDHRPAVWPHLHRVLGRLAVGVNIKPRE